MKRILLVLLVVASSGIAAGAQRRDLIRRAPHPIRSQYIVVLKPGSDATAVGSETAGLRGGRVKHVYQRALRGFAVRMPEAEAQALATDPRVAYVEEDGVAYGSDAQPAPPWGLDRVDQRGLPLDSRYGYAVSGAGVHVYVIDSGIRETHQEFGGRASIMGDFIDDDGDGDPNDIGNDDADPTRPDGFDCVGHGTHVAGTIGGATYGVAKAVTIHALRALGCNNTGSWSGIIAAVDLITADHQSPAVVNMSIQGGAMQSVDDAIRRSVAAGVTYAIAAGNYNADASSYSPARIGEAITVGATDTTDARASFSNYGTVLDLFAPGVGVTSAYHTSDTATASMSGTSMATPHVAGAAALYLGVHPSATPRQARDALVNAATSGVVESPGTGSPNALLYTGFITPPTPPTVTVIAPDGGETLATDTPISIQWSASDPDGLARFDVEASSDGVNYAAVPGCSALDGTRRSCTWAAPGPVTTSGRIRVTARDTAGDTAFDVSDAAFRIVAAAGGTLPAPWVHEDVGSVGRAGDAAYASGAFTVSAGGTDVWSTSDAFHFVHQSWTGDGDLVARVEQLTRPADASFAMAAVMFRESMAAGARHASMVITSDGKAKFRRRTTTGGVTASDGPSTGTTPVPRWLKVTRRGNVFTAYLSTDGSSWAEVRAGETIAMPQTLEVGFLALRNGGTSLASARLTGVQIAAPATSALPAGWSSGDVGAVGAGGSVSYAAGTWTVEGGGADVWGTADAFQFVHRQWTGDGDVVARIAALTRPADAAFAMGGIMIRESMAAGARHVAMVVSTEAKAKFRRRVTTGGVTSSDGPSTGTTPVPRWVKLTRRGNVFSAYLSTDGTSWIQVYAGVTVALPATVEVGLVTLRNGGSGLADARFTNVAVSAAGGLPSGWTSADVGAAGTAGSADYADGVFTIRAGGTDLWSTADAFHFAYRMWTGDGEIVARLAELRASPGSAFALGAVEMRESLAASARHAALMITTDGKAKFRRRLATGGVTASDGPSAGTTSAPRWMKLARRGTTFTAYLSTDGSTWAAVHEGESVALPSTLYVGIVGLRSGGTTAMSARFDNVEVR